MSIAPCPNSIVCPDTEYPLSNYSSESPDPPIWIRVPSGGGRVNFAGGSSGGNGGPIAAPDGGPMETNHTYASDLICIGEAYSEFLEYLGVPPIVFDVTSGAIPSWIAADLDTFRVTLTGTPSETDVGDNTFTIQATDATGQISVKTFYASVFGITTISLPDTQKDVDYIEQLEAGGGTPGYSFDLVGGSIPTGLSLSPSGLISGHVSSSIVAPKTFSFIVRVGDGLLRTCDKSMSILVTGCSGAPTTAWTITQGGRQPPNPVPPPVFSDSSGSFDAITQTGICSEFSTSGVGFASQNFVTFTSTPWTSPHPECNIKITINWTFVASGSIPEMEILAPGTHIIKTSSDTGSTTIIVPSTSFALAQTITFKCETPDGSNPGSATVGGSFSLTFV